MKKDFPPGTGALHARCFFTVHLAYLHSLIFLAQAASVLQEAMEAFRDMVELAAKGTATEFMTDLILIMLMKTNACDSRPAAVLDVLLVHSYPDQMRMSLCCVACAHTSLCIIPPLQPCISVRQDETSCNM